MTAIYGFSDRKNDRCALAADDREGNSGSRVDKVHQLFSRYSVAVSGVSITVFAIEAVGHFEGIVGHTPPQTVRELAGAILGALRVVASSVGPHYEEAVRKKELPEADWERVKANSAEIVILDRSECVLFQVDFGYPFGPNGLDDTPSVTELTDGKLHCFALAADIPIVRGTAPEVESPLHAYFERLISTDRRFKKKIGNLGAYAFLENGRHEFGSTYKDPVDKLEQELSRGLLGFQITVIQSGDTSWWTRLRSHWKTR